MNLLDLTKFKAPKLVQKELTVTPDSKLLVQVRATHSGYLVYNNRVYPGKKMRASYKTFISRDRGGTAEFDKPVLKHHDGGVFGGPSDPIGRVVGAKFVALKSGPAFDNDFMNPDTPNNGGRGSGYILLDLEVSDQDAIEKILDGRLSTVSVGFTPLDEYRCSVCGKNWLLDGFCDHQPGKVYVDEKTKDRILCYGITGKMRYNEVSFVNFPAAPLAQVVGKGDSAESCTLTRCDRAVRGLVLVDEEGEHNLLEGASGKPGLRSQRTDAKAIVTVGSLFQQTVQTQDPEDLEARLGPDIDGDDAVARQESVHNEPPNDEGDTMKDKKPEKTPDPEPTQVTDKVLQASLEALTAERDGLKATIEAKDEELTKLNGKIEEKDGEIARLQEEVDQLRAEMSRTLAESYLTARIMLGKPGTDGLDDPEAYKDALEKYASRTIDSLRDSLADLAPELEAFRAPKQEEPEKPAKKIDKVEDPTLGKWTTTPPTGPISKDQALEQAFKGE